MSSSFDPSKNTHKSFVDDWWWSFLSFALLLLYLLLLPRVCTTPSLCGGGIILSFWKRTKSFLRFPSTAPRCDDDVSREKERDRDGEDDWFYPLIQKTVSSITSLFLSQSLFDSLSLSQRGRKREKKTKNDERRRRKTTSVAMTRVCVLPSRVNKKGWSVVRRPKNAFFLVFFFSHKKKGKKKRTIV